MRARTVVVSVACAALALVASGCSSSDGAEQEPGLTVVASSNVWGDVAAQVAGDLAQVTSIIDDPSVDPHSYEASARVELTISRADLVVVNGGGYDDFATQLVDALDTPPPVVDAVEVSGLADDGDAEDEHAEDEHADDEHADGEHAGDEHADDEHAGDGHAHGELNEHVWYDLPTVQAVAREIADALGRVAPEHAEAFGRNADDFAARVGELEQSAAQVAAEHAGTGVVVTEPVPLYLVEAAGLVDRTPAAFSSSIEQEVDVPPAAMDEALELVASRDVALLVYNEQTTGPQTDQVLQAARDAGLPVVDVTETLPEDEDYVSWMAGNLDALAEALA
ncbi:MAG: zinc ABC transporter substrate-binding protein [Cellulomonas sp.]|uniref:metal ABC transporter solute-binding protein, Zn/Mn family n=1 Tax=Cellulomonas sp. TaxID=40001 RepID=UPI002586C60B|nr:zinc ABC transporter substrate-binding protein [Cellulomonas sp.]MCR6704064.1 zinc ABC transporter substrate-binding protein [Cellulomonas sp.]